MSKFISAMGKPIDMAAIRSRNEKTRAVGNMNVNANGDTINSNNEVTDDSTQRVNRVYNKTTVNPTARPTRARIPDPVVESTAPTIEPDEFSQMELDFEQELDDEVVPEKTSAKKK